MSDMIVNEYGLTPAIKALLEANLPTGVTVTTNIAVDQDGEALPFPYVRINQIDTTSFYGPAFVAPEADSCIPYMISTFGEREDQVAFIRNKVQRILVGRNNGQGSFLFDLSFDNHEIMMRSLGLKSRMKRAGKRYFVEDNYDIEITSQV